MELARGERSNGIGQGERERVGGREGEESLKRSGNARDQNTR